MSRTHRIRSALQELLLFALEAMQHDVSNSKVPLRALSELVITGANTFKLQDNIEPDYGIWLTLIWIRAKEHSSYKAFREAIDALPEISQQLNTMVVTNESQKRIDHDDVIQSFLSKYLEKSGFKLEFNQYAFDTVYQQLMDCFLQSSFDTTYFAPLEYFDTDIESLEVLPGILVRRLSTAQVEQLWKKSSAIQNRYRHLSPYTISPLQLKAIIETRIKSEKFIEGQPRNSAPNDLLPSDEARRRFELVLTALRLLKAGSVNIGFIISDPSNWLFEIGSAASKSRAYSPAGSTYCLSESDIPELQRIAKALETLGGTPSSSLQVALRRLGYVAGRVNNEDKLIDAMIAFEAMILSDAGVPRERGELRFRLSLRVAHLLAGNAEQQEENFDIIRKAYDLRSRVVHGDSLSVADIADVEKALELCRQCAKSMVLMRSRGDSPDWKRWLFHR